MDDELGDPFDRLLRLGAAHASDACRTLGVPYGIAGERLRQITPRVGLAGIAVTLRLHLVAGARPYRENALRQFALGRSVSHAVLVISNEVPGFDTVGSFDARLARASGYRGYLCEGPVRDTEELAALGFPVFATAVRADCIRLSDLPAGTSIGFDFGGSVEVAGMLVEAGATVVANGDGAITFPTGRLGDVLAAGDELAAREAGLVARLGGGATVAQILAESE